MSLAKANRTVFAGALAVAALCGVLLSGGRVASADDMSKDKIEQIVHDYIVAHPEVILKAVDDYQKADSEKKQADALKLNHEELFNNEKSPFIGNPTGDVTMIEFFDYNCHYCKQIFPELKSLAEADKNLKIIFKDFPILGPTSETSAKWALAAQKQGKYFDFHKKMMEHKGPFTDDDVQAIAKGVGMDLGKGKADAEGADVLIQIERNRELAQQMSFNGTPSFVINQEAFSGVPDKDELKQKIDDARKKTAGDSKGAADDGKTDAPKDKDGLGPDKLGMPDKPADDKKPE